MTKKFNELLSRMSPEDQSIIQAEAASALKEMALAELRRARGMSHVHLADILALSPTDIGKMEKNADMYISTLRSLIEGMGGNLEITAHFKNADISITNFSEI